MANYNPLTPGLLGEEWVGIREELTQFTPGVANLEIGHTFRTQVTKRLGGGFFYLNKIPSGKASGTIMGVHLYPLGAEEDSGPVKRLIIPVSNGSATGTSSFGGGAVNYDDALNSPGDGKYVAGQTGANQTRWQFWFKTNDFASVLTGKRILGVNLLYNLANVYGTFPFESRRALAMSLYAETPYANGWGIGTGDNAGTFGNLVESPTLAISYPTGRVGIGTINPFPATSNQNNQEPSYWTAANLQRFEQSAASNRLSILVYGQSGGTTTFQAGVQYLAMEVLYCEERRVAFGLKRFGSFTDPFLISGVAYQNWIDNRNQIAWRDPTTYSFLPLLPAGDYLMTLSMEKGPDSDSRTSTESPDINALREYTSVPGITGRVITRPWPLDDLAVDEQFQVTQTRVLPQFSISTSGSPLANVLTEGHVYGRQAKAAVYGTITATQEILDSVALAPYSYPQVRFYARRFGDTTQPLKLSSPTISGAGQSVQITPPEFDALTEIVDGWKEVTLRFSSPPTMGAGTTPQWQFSSAGELSGNQWQVLGLWAPTISGANTDTAWVPSNPWLQYNGNRTDVSSQATYGAPSAGPSVNLGWLSPMVTTTTDDLFSDAVLLFSQDPSPPTSFAVTQQTQELSTVDPTCFAASCVPTSITYNRLSWTPVSGAYADAFATPAVSGWGGNWTISGGSVAEYGVSEGIATHTHNATATRHTSWVTNKNALNHEVYVEASVPAIAAGSAHDILLTLRTTDALNAYLAGIRLNTDGTVNGFLASRVAGTVTIIANSVYTGLNYQANGWLSIRAQVSGNNLRVKAWAAGTPEPDAWFQEVTSTAITAPGAPGVQSQLNSGSTNTLPFTFSFRNFEAGPLDFGSYQVQRFDTVDGRFTTIADITTPTVTGFADYEARVGYPSVYRVRTLNTYDFAGLWSPQVTGTVPVPGVAGASTGLLIFTTNSVQTGLSNLAYSEAWMGGQPVEDFAWPESGTVVLQDMYGKDYPTAFKPLERGGERFARTILVNASGIPPAVTARGFDSLRDMAWANVPYICVRDETGERWYATVVVPSGSVRRMVARGRLCLASVQIVETSVDPYPVDGGS